MTERPIIFARESMLALLAGRKTQTRRIVHPRYIAGLGDDPCPYGLPGDLLWCRETWGLHKHFDFTDWNRDSVRGATRDDVLTGWQLDYRADWKHDHCPCYWRSPIFMPRWASRLTLEIIDVRLERVQEISNDDSMAEGFFGFTDPGCLTSYPEQEPWEQFKLEWDRINGKRAPWASNPWVWVLTVKRIG